MHWRRKRGMSATANSKVAHDDGCARYALASKGIVSMPVTKPTPAATTIQHVTTAKTMPQRMEKRRPATKLLRRSHQRPSPSSPDLKTAATPTQERISINPVALTPNGILERHAWTTTMTRASTTWNVETCSDTVN